jgi:hypothetical protein
MSIGGILAAGAAIVAGLAVATSIWLNPPSENRARALDAERTRRLATIENAITGYYQKRQALPKDLETLDAEYSYIARETLHDPGTGQLFEYGVLGEKDYRLCAVFERSADGISSYSPKHKAGRDCFERKVVVR